MFLFYLKDGYLMEELKKKDVEHLAETLKDRDSVDYELF